MDADNAPRGIEFARWVYVTGCALTVLGYFGFGGPDGEGTGERLWYLGWVLVLLGILAELGMRALRRRERHHKPGERDDEGDPPAALPDD